MTMDEEDPNSVVTRMLEDDRIQLAIAQIVQAELEEANKKGSEMENQLREQEREKVDQVGKLNAKLEIADEKIKSLSEELKRLKEERVEVDEKLAEKDKQLSSVKQEMCHLSAAYGDLKATKLVLERLVEMMKKEEETKKAENKTLKVSLEKMAVIEGNDKDLQNEVTFMEDDEEDTANESTLDTVPNDVPAAHISEKRRSSRKTAKNLASPKTTEAAASPKAENRRSSPRKKSTSQIQSEVKRQQDDADAEWKTFVCSQCTNRRFKTLDDLGKHISDCHGKKYSVWLDRKTRIKEVVTDEHGVEHGYKDKRDNRVLCKCGKDYSTRNDLSRHLFKK